MPPQHRGQPAASGERADRPATGGGPAPGRALAAAWRELGSVPAIAEAFVEFEREVSLMSDGTLEKDMLDEKARYALNVSRSDEIVIFK